MSFFFRVKAGVSRGITQGTPREPNSIFEEFLESRHGQFLKTYIEKNDPLPLFDSEILKTPVPTLKGRPSLLLYNLPGGDHQPITQVTKIQSAMKKAKNNLLVLLGTSGCGKTRTCYELLCCNWGLYFVALRKGNGGSCDIESIEGYLRLNNMITDDFESNRQHADHKQSYTKSSNIFTPRVANSTTGYTLDKFFSEPSESRPTFYFPENLCGPDLIFFVEFENNIRVPVFVQMKLRYSVSVIEEVLSTLHPKMFYRDINGKLASEKTNKPVIEKITKLCEENCLPS
ncbi:unnamed protein product [Rhizophagus irregularis]|nr:unnamed protein product [Rhizophagus irregularis]